MNQKIKEKKKSKNNHNARNITIMISIFLLAIIIGILIMQRYVFFYPWHDKDSYNTLKTNTSFQEITIESNGQKLNGWLKYNTDKNKKSPLLIFFGGNMQNSSNAMLYFESSNKYNYFENYNVMMIDYPGYGLSKGGPSKDSLLKAGLNIYDYAKNQNYVDKNNITVLGYSIGSGVATYVASERNVSGLILIAPYDELISVYNSNFNIFYGPLRLLARYNFTSNNYAKNVKVPPLVITSYDDEVINYKFAEKLVKNFNKTYKFTTLDHQISHNSYFNYQHTLTDIHDYLQTRINKE